MSDISMVCLLPILGGRKLSSPFCLEHPRRLPCTQTSRWSVLRSHTSNALRPEQHGGDPHARSTVLLQAVAVAIDQLPGCVQGSIRQYNRSGEADSFVRPLPDLWTITKGREKVGKIPFFHQVWLEGAPPGLAWGCSSLKWTRYLGAHLRARCIQERIKVELKSRFGISTKSKIRILIEIWKRNIGLVWVGWCSMIRRKYVTKL